MTVHDLLTLMLLALVPLWLRYGTCDDTETFPAAPDAGSQGSAGGGLLPSAGRGPVIGESGPEWWTPTTPTRVIGSRELGFDDGPLS